MKKAIIEKEPLTIHPLEVRLVEVVGPKKKAFDKDALTELECCILDETDPKIAKRKMHALQTQYVRQIEVLTS